MSPTNKQAGSMWSTEVGSFQTELRSGVLHASVMDKIIVFQCDLIARCINSTAL